MEQIIGKAIGSALGDLAKTLSPIGAITLYAGRVAPDQWAFCDGSAISRIEYPALFGVIETTFGSGDGLTTYNLPNLPPFAPSIRLIIHLGPKVERITA